MNIREISPEKIRAFSWIIVDACSPEQFDLLSENALFSLYTSDAQAAILSPASDRAERRAKAMELKISAFACICPWRIAENDAGRLFFDMSNLYGGAAFSNEWIRDQAVENSAFLSGWHARRESEILETCAVRPAESRRRRI